MLVASERLTMTALLEYLDLLQQDIGQKGGMASPSYAVVFH